MFKIFSGSYVGYVYSRSSCHGQRTHAMVKHHAIKKKWEKLSINIHPSKSHTINKHTKNMLYKKQHKVITKNNKKKIQN